jgi:methyl-accepting chemotaxis protein
METYILWLTIFVGLLTLALVVQAIAIFMIYRTIANLVEETTGWRQTMYQQTREIMTNVSALTAAVKESGQQVAANVSSITQDARRRVEKIERTADAITEGVRRGIANQIIRLDHLMTSALDSLEQVGTKVRHAAFQPVREVTALYAGFRTALDYLKNSHKRNGRTPRELEEPYT